MPFSDVLGAIGVLQRQSELNLDRKRFAAEQEGRDRGLKAWEEHTQQGGDGTRLEPSTPAQIQSVGSTVDPATRTRLGLDAPIGGGTLADPHPVTAPVPASPGTAPTMLDMTDPQLQGANARGIPLAALTPRIGQTQSNMSINLATGAVTWSKHPTTTDERRSSGAEYMGWAIRNGVPLGIAQANAEAGGLKITDDDMHELVAPDWYITRQSIYAKAIAEGTNPVDAMVQATIGASKSWGWAPRDEWKTLTEAQIKPFQEARIDHWRRQQAVADGDFIRMTKKDEAFGSEVGTNLGSEATLPSQVKVTGELEKTKQDAQPIGPTVAGYTGQNPLMPTSQARAEITEKQLLSLPPEKRKEYGHLKDSRDSLFQLYDLAAKIVNPKTISENPGVFERTSAGVTIKWAAIKQDTELGKLAATYANLHGALGASVSKGIGDQSGQLAVQEIQWSLGFMPYDPDSFMLPSPDQLEMQREFISKSMQNKMSNLLSSSMHITRESAKDEIESTGIESQRIRSYMDQLQAENPEAARELLMMPDEKSAPILDLIGAGRADEITPEMFQ